MTDLEELNRQVAEADGWKRIEYRDVRNTIGPITDRECFGTDPEGYGDGEARVPNFAEDHNAAHGLLDKLRKERKVISMEYNQYGWQVVVLADYDVVTEDCNLSFCVAVCRVFLAVRKEKK